MTAIDLEAEYNNRQRVPEYQDIQARWLADTAAARETLNCEFDVAYGDGARQQYDVVHPTSDRAADAPLVVYIHGGYWQRGEREEYTGIARVMAERGVRVLLPSYTLCPENSVAGIVDELRSFCAVAWRRFKRRPVVIGHSAGGQLAASMLASDWSSVGSDLPADLVQSAYAISGVFELAPLIQTSLNEALGLTEETALPVSPRFGPPPAAPKTFIAAVGAAESSEFHRQSLDMCETWSRAGITAECVFVPRANHFTIVDELTIPHSAMLNRIVDLATTGS